MLKAHKSIYPQIGDVYYAQFDGCGSEQKGIRPAVIFQNNKGNIYSPNVIVLPLTSKIKKTVQPTHVFVSSEDSGLPKDSMVLCENPVCMSKDKLGKRITKLPIEYMKSIAEASILASSAISFISPSRIDSLLKIATSLNDVTTSQ